GSGLGLPMVQGFALQSGGTVRIHSRLGEGTTVELWLPRAEVPPAAETAQQSVMNFEHGTASVLLCDDDDQVRRFLTEFLQSLDYAVVEARDGQTAVQLLEEGAKADLLVVDYAMPGMNGLETIRQARLRRPNLPSLLISGFAGVPISVDVP